MAPYEASPFFRPFGAGSGRQFAGGRGIAPGMSIAPQVIDWREVTGLQDPAGGQPSAPSIARFRFLSRDCLSLVRIYAVPAPPVLPVRHNPSLSNPDAFAEAFRKGLRIALHQTRPGPSFEHRPTSQWHRNGQTE